MRHEKWCLVHFRRVMNDRRTGATHPHTAAGSARRLEQENGMIVYVTIALESCNVGYGPPPCLDVHVPRFREKQALP